MDSRATTVGTLLFLEAKRASASPSEIEEVEYQAFTAAYAYHVETGIKHIWTMTCVGSCAQLWIFSESSTYLIPYIPAGQGLAERTEYLEISTHGRQIANDFDRDYIDHCITDVPHVSHGVTIGVVLGSHKVGGPTPPSSGPISARGIPNSNWQSKRRSWALQVAEEVGEDSEAQCDTGGEEMYNGNLRYSSTISR
ncbi:hypothetical protein V8F33_000723 [Rhypophila sp. PSN 637]